MNDKRFDDIVRGKLSDLRSDSTPKWNLFLEKKKAADLIEDNKYFDKKVRQDLTRFRVEYNPSHWTLLKSRMMNISRIEKSIKRIKSLELVSLFVLLFLFYNSHQHKSNPSLAEHSTSLYQHEEIQVDNSKGELNKNNNENNVQIRLGDDVISEVNKAVNSEDGQTPSLTEELKPSISKNVNRDNVGLIENDRSGFANTFTENRNTIDDNDSRTTSSNLANLDSKSRTLSDIEYISTLEVEDINYTIEFPFISNDFGIKPLAFSSFVGNSIKVFVSFDNNMIYTPDDLEYNTTARTTEMYGFTIGVLYGKRFGAIELESGLTVSRYNKPWDFRQQYGNFTGFYRYTFTNIKNNFVGIPFAVKYHIIQNEDWSIFGKAGLTSEFVVNTQYNSENIYLGGSPITPGSTGEPTETPLSPFEIDRNFSEGLFQGGSLSDNLFIRTHFGLGIERIISSRVSTYFSGEYHLSVINKDLGPNNDRINKFGFNVGLKLNI